jgi:hypothetical protein
MRRAEHHSRALQTAIVGVAVAALIFGFALAKLLPANSDTLRVHLGTLESSIAEALTLARADDEGRLTRNYFETELDLLREDVEKTAEGLASSRPEPELRPRFAEAEGLARSAADGLRALGVAGAPAESVIAGEATLASIQARAKAMKHELE